MKMKMNKFHALQIHFEAKCAAKQAVQDIAREYQADNPDNEYGEPIFPCGFAWVHIPNGRGTFAKSLREAGEATKHYSGRGLHVHSPAEHHGQYVGFHEAGAHAYARVLNEYGIEAMAQSRLD
tara:strand:+ start:406 stop:774 length:369 start_codon:yes stop_codon:yes gene_type:complete